jgi:hypothetical protein
MAAAATDKLRKKKSNFSTTLSSGIDDSVKTIPLNSASGLPTDTAVTLTIDRVDANSVSTPTKMERVTGVISGNNLTDTLRGEDSSTAQAHSSGAVVEDIWDADTWNDLVGVLMSNFEQVSGRMKNETFYAADGGSTDTYAITLSPAPAAYQTGMLVIFKANTINTGAATLNVNSLGAKTIKKWYNQDLADGDIKANQIVACVYDGTNFQLLSEIGNVVDLTTTQTLTNKTLTTPVIASLYQDAGKTKLMTIPDTASDTLVALEATQTLSGKTLTSPVFQGDLTGWISAGETWTYASSTTFTVSGDQTTKYPKGTKIKLTQTSAKYFYVTATSYVAPNTTVTVTGGSDYSLTNATITSPYYSYVDRPQGFPSYFNFTQTYTGFSVNPTNTCRFFVSHGFCFYMVRGSGGGTSNSTSKSITAPITNAGLQANSFGICLDNGSWQTLPCHARLPGASATVNLGKTVYDGNWSNSGGCQFEFDLIYTI